MAWWSKKKEKREPAAEKRSIPSGLWEKCDECGEILEAHKVAAGMRVCPKCGHHFSLSTEQRMRLLTDEGTFEEHDGGVEPEDRLGFRDSKRYADRLKSAAKSADSPDAFREGVARIEGHEVAIGFFVFEFMGGSMGSVVGEKIARLFERARERRIPAIICSASGGARMQEGILSLMQLPRTVIAVEEIKDAGLPFIVILADPTTGGVSASFAMLGDIAIAEPGAIIGFAGARVIEETIREKLPPGFQRAEYLLEHGMVDIVVHRHQLREKLIAVLKLLLEPQPTAEVVALPQPDLEIPPRNNAGAPP
jgi:acetyl-CoA carboxylase carboxyl transferase subunit beta